MLGFAGAFQDYVYLVHFVSIARCHLLDLADHGVLLLLRSFFRCVISFSVSVVTALDQARKCMILDLEFELGLVSHTLISRELGPLLLGLLHLELTPEAGVLLDQRSLDRLVGPEVVEAPIQAVEASCSQELVPVKEAATWVQPARSTNGHVQLVDD